MYVPQQLEALNIQWFPEICIFNIERSRRSPRVQSPRNVKGEIKYDCGQSYRSSFLICSGRKWVLLCVELTSGKRLFHFKARCSTNECLSSQHARIVFLQYECAMSLSVTDIGYLVMLEIVCDITSKNRTRL